MDLSPFSQYKQVEKAWGREIWLCNSPLYCAKLLLLTEGQQCSLHRHLAKDETFFMLEGSGVYLELFQPRPYKDSDLDFKWLGAMLPGDSHNMWPGLYHRFWSPEGPAVLLEVSTFHDDLDVERLEPSGPIARAAALAASPVIKES